jgi:hypothetical protein
MRSVAFTACAVMALAAPAPLWAQHTGHDMPMPMPQQPQPQPQPAEQGAHQMPAAPAQAEHQGHEMPMAGTAPADTGMSGEREASGTSWQPEVTPHGGIHLMRGGWMLMGHALINLVYDRQQGPRGGEQGFVSGMVMGEARREIGEGSLQLRAMLSPDPLMGARGYPLLLAAGETANGVDELVDRQHPHDLFMELSARYTRRFGGHASAFLYAGLPGEPAFGPPAFMHRLSIMDSPEAPISHHWLDSTHISFGVLTAGLVLGNFKIEGSRFNGREPDRHRWNIETGPLDSTALRLSWNPTHNLALQASWAHLVSPEQLQPGVNSTRWSASALYTRRLGAGRWWSTTLAWGRRDGDDALALESAAGLGRWTLFARAEWTENDELVPGGPAWSVGKVSAGAIRDFRIAPHLRLGLGGLYAFSFVPRALENAYGGDPSGAMAFVRLRID